MTESETAAVLRQGSNNCGRHVPDSEINAAVRKAFASTWNSSNSNQAATSTPPRCPAVDHEKREHIIRTHGGLADLWEVSPRRIEDKKQHTEEIIDVLFPGNPLLCCGWTELRRNDDDDDANDDDTDANDDDDGKFKTKICFTTLSRDEWRGKLHRLQFIVPSPMIARNGLTKDGRESAHALSNTGPRRFLVVEFDGGTADEQAAILLHLAACAPLALGVHSGRKSLHGWFYCKGQLDEQLRRFMRYAVSLGADPATWNRSQFVRMPDGTRDIKTRQTVFFFNPTVIQ